MVSQCNFDIKDYSSKDVLHSLVQYQDYLARYSLNISKVAAQLVVGRVSVDAHHVKTDVFLIF